MSHTHRGTIPDYNPNPCCHSPERILSGSQRVTHTCTTQAHRHGPYCISDLSGLTPTPQCDEIAVRLRILSTSYRGGSIPIVVALCTLVLIAIRCSPRGLVGMPVDKVLLGQDRGDDNLGACQHRDQHSGCPASVPNLARPRRLCPGATQGLAAWGPMLTRRHYGAKGLVVSCYEGGMWHCTSSMAFY